MYFPVAQLWHPSFSAYRLMPRTIHTIYLRSSVRFLMAPLPTRLTCLFGHPPCVSSPPSLRPCRKNQTQQEQYTERNPNSNPDLSGIRVRIYGRLCRHRRECSSTRVVGIVDGCRSQRRGSIRPSKNIAERRIATAGSRL